MHDVRVRRTLVAGVAVAVIATALTTLSSSASTSFAFTRLAGADRYDTAHKIATSTFKKSGAVVLASGEDAHLADAVAGGYVAGIGKVPILLTGSTFIPQTTSDALTELGTTNIVILGGLAAVSAGVEKSLQISGYATSRLAGSDRYDTARKQAISAGADKVGSLNMQKTAIVASGEDAHIADALTGSPMAYAAHFPTLLTASSTLSPAASQALTALGIQHVLVLGGSSAVADSVLLQIQLMGITTQRLNGDDRTGTATAIADFELSSLSFKNSHVNLARGDVFADALTGGVHAGQEDPTPVLLTLTPNALGASTGAWLANNAQPLRDGHIFGGLSAVAGETETKADDVVHKGSLPECTTSTTSALPFTTSPPTCVTTTTSASSTTSTTSSSSSSSPSTLPVPVCPTLGPPFCPATLPGP